MWPSLIIVFHFRMQEAFHGNHCLPCGFCTRGILITPVELLRDSPALMEKNPRISISRQSVPSEYYRATPRNG
jgi:aerobic-type carbon monoxide dehydrogenase small subunit (CoxS/CutS family)